jgi:site-specific DNA-methyltransferase (adenine-specific)
MERVGENRIIFGGNYFTDILPPSPCWILWDKDSGEGSYADFELAWGSFSSAAKKIRHRWSGMLQENMAEKETRYHPTQKPVRVMSYILERYTSHGDVVFDPFCGSGTTLVAAKMLGRRFIGIDIEKKYCDIAEERLRNTTPPLPFTTEKMEQECLL